MRAVIITPFYTYDYPVRIKYIERYLKSIGYEVTIVTADYDHRRKISYNTQRPGLELIHVPAYKKNISLKRIYSHYVFAKEAYNRLNELTPDFIYGSTPPNFLVKYLTRYKNEHNNVKLMLEVGDLWPETLPMNRIVKKTIKPVLNFWSYVRDKYISNADGIVFECDLFQNQLSNSIGRTYYKTIYLCKENSMPVDYLYEITNDEITFSYIGSINNIIDINLIVIFLYEVQKYKKVKLEIIGGGEQTNLLKRNCSLKGIEYKDNGIIYDESKKSQILRHCQFGLNIMKNSVTVGATMKSLEYFHWGLGVINNIPSDTQRIISNYECGYNINIENYKIVAKHIGNMQKSDIIRIMNKSRQVYLELFDERIMSLQFNEFFNKINNTND